MDSITTNSVLGLVSVIIPTYNRAGSVFAALDSVKEQTYRPIEAILVDDGSTDETAVLANKWSERNCDKELRLRYVLQGNQGAPAARNHGLRLARGEFVQLLDSDDALHPMKIQLHVQCLRSDPSADFAYGPIVELENPEHVIYAQSEMSPRRAVLKHIRVPVFQTMGPLCRRSMIREIGWMREDIAPFEDWEYHGRACVMGMAGRYVKDAISYYRCDDSNGDKLSNTGQISNLTKYIYGESERLKSLYENATAEWKVDAQFRFLLFWNCMRMIARARCAGYRESLKEMEDFCLEMLQSSPLHILAKGARLMRAGFLGGTASKTCLAADCLYWKSVALRKKLSF